MGAHEPNETWVLVVGETAQVPALIEALGQAGFRASPAVTPSDLPDVLASPHPPTFAVVDLRSVVPWRAAGIARMVPLLLDRGVRIIQAGGQPAVDDVPARMLHLLPADVSTARLVERVQQLDRAAVAAALVEAGVAATPPAREPQPVALADGPEAAEPVADPAPGDPPEV